MLATLFAAASALSLVSALPQQSHRGSEPAWFNPYEKFPAPTEHPPANTTSQGAFYDKAWAAAAKFKALSTYGPGTVVTNPAGLAWYQGDLNSGTGGVQPSNSYQCFNGQVNSYPPASQWMNFYTMFNLNQRNAMAWTSYGPGPDTGEQQGEIYNAIVSVSQQSKVDARLILATIIQESGGCVNVPCTAGYNCGLMQANHGSVSYNPGNSIAQSQASINQMVTDGTEGTTQGPGLASYMNGGSDYGYTHCAAGNPYASARAYNTGSCSTSGNLNCAQYGTASYVNDIANRLIGWDGTNSPQWQCNFPAVGCV